MFFGMSFLILLLAHSRDVKSQPKAIFLLAGQSNMAGRGGVVDNRWDGVVPPECRPDPRILRLNSALIWEEAAEPLHRDIDVDRACGIGPGMPFSRSILRSGSPGIIGLVPCAVGGTNITEWRRGGGLYGRLLSRVQAAVRGGGGGTIRGLLWYQGESDTESLVDAKQYKGRLEKLFNDFRTDLGSPSLPVIQVALASGKGPYVEMIREAQLGTNLPNVKCVDAGGLPLEPDGLHLSTAAQLRLGEMLADAFLQFPTALPLPVSAGAATHASFFVLAWGFFLQFCTQSVPIVFIHC